MLLVVIVIIIARGTSAGENEVPVMHTDLDYESVSKEVEKMTFPIYARSLDRPLSADEEQTLKKALIKMQGLIAYRPDMYNNYFNAAKAYHLLGDYQTAIKYAQTASSIGFPSGSPTTEYLQNCAAAKYIESRAWFNLRDYQKAADAGAQAVHFDSHGLNYRIAEARAEIQMGHDNSALGILNDVLKIDPSNTDARNLIEFVNRNPSKG